MKARAKSQKPLTLQQQIKQIEVEIANLKKQLLKPHFIKDAEQDYDIKSHIINKQNEMIELLVKQTNKNIKKK